MHNINQLEQQIWTWVDQVVIGLNLCPFAKKPRVNKQIKLLISDAKNDDDLFKQFLAEVEFIRDVDPNMTDTSLFAIADHLSDFDEYLNFLAIANMTIQQMGLEGDFQLASFHPEYQFEDTEITDRANLTNKAPCPIIHIIREATVEKVLEKYPSPEAIPENNINTVNELTDHDVSRLFPYL